jgi:SagB-type dehydrogenase family enzyme
MSIVIILTACAGMAHADGQDLELEKHRQLKDSGLVDSLENRHSTREFSGAEVSLSDLSDILWAADGVNRKDGFRTAPSPLSLYPIDIYIASDKGIYKYDPNKGLLKFINGLNVKSKIAVQYDVAKAYYILIMTADYSKLPSRPGLNPVSLANLEGGCIAQNAALMAAALKLGTRMVTSMKSDVIISALNLDTNSVPLYLMPLGR